MTRKHDTDQIITVECLQGISGCNIHVNAKLAILTLLHKQTPFSLAMSLTPQQDNPLRNSIKTSHELIEENEKVTQNID